MKTMAGKRSAPKAARTGNRAIGGGGGMWSQSNTKSWSSPAAPPAPKPVDKVVFEVGELVMSDAASDIMPRVVYRIAKRVKSHSWNSQYEYDLVAALDPMGNDKPQRETGVNPSTLRRITIVDLGSARLKLDNFIKEEVKRLQGEA